MRKIYERLSSYRVVVFVDAIEILIIFSLHKFFSHFISIVNYFLDSKFEDKKENQGRKFVQVKLHRANEMDN